MSDYRKKKLFNTVIALLFVVLFCAFLCENNREGFALFPHGYFNFTILLNLFFQVLFVLLKTAR